MKIRFRMLKPVATAILGGLLLQSVAAEAETCRHAPAILSLSDTVLNHRKSPVRLGARRFGATAAYLKIRYGRMSAEDIQVLLQGLLEDRDHGSLELAATWLVKEQGPGDVLTEFGAELKQRPDILFSISLLRALLLAGAHEMVIAQLVQAPPAEQWQHAQNLTIAVLDQPDALKERLADAALSGGLTRLALGLTATRLDPAAWDAIVKKVDPAEIQTWAPYWRTMRSAAGGPGLVIASPQTGVQAESWSKFHDVAVAAALQPQREFLSAYLNQTGQVDRAQAAALSLRREIEAGSLPRAGTFDRAWLAAYAELRRLTDDPAVLDRDLAATAGVRPQRSSVRAELDWIMAIDALGPYLRRETDAEPLPPDTLSGEMVREWGKWIGMARLVREDPGSPGLASSEASLAIAAELLLGAGKSDQIAAQIEGRAPSATTVAIADDLLMRLDRMCASYLWYPGEALLLAGRPVFRFDDTR